MLSQNWYESIDLSKGLFIEASAGTGKTFALEKLFIRLIREGFGRQGIPLRRILCVTFTRKASGELKERLRKSLNEALPSSTDAGAQEVFRQALSSFDQASIHTIHGFLFKQIQYFSSEASFFRSLNVTEKDSLKEKAVRDVLFKFTEQSSEQAIKGLSAYWGNSGFEHFVEQLLNYKMWDDPYGILYQTFPESISVLADGDTAREKIASEIKQSEVEVEDYSSPEREEEMSKVKRRINKCLSHLMETPDFPMKTWLEFMATFGKNDFSRDLAYSLINFNTDIKKLRTDIENVLNEIENPKKKFQFFTITKNKSAVTYKKTLFDAKEHLKIVSSEVFEREYDRFTAILTPSLESLLKLSKEYCQLIEKKESLLRRLGLWYSLELFWQAYSLAQQYMREKGELNYQSINIHLQKFIQQKKTRVLKNIAAHYDVVLIDEFQDTDPYQWSLFQEAFAGSSVPLITVGDPKQAIYRFRGGDIFTYYKARSFQEKLGAGRVSLDKNYRSCKALVEAGNKLFSAMFTDIGMVYEPVDYHVSDGHIHNAEGTLPALQGIGWDNAQQKKEDDQWGIVTECERLLKGGYLVGDKALQAGDIAVLSRGHDNLEALRGLFSKKGINVRIKDQSLLADAMEVLWLEALLYAYTHDKKSVNFNALLYSSVFALESSEASVEENEEALSELESALLIHLSLFKRHRFNALHFCQHFFSFQWEGTSVRSRILRLDNGRRIYTNLKHLAEVFQNFLQQESLADDHNLVGLFLTCMEKIRTDKQSLHVHSDEDAVQLMTLHAAKGLEFPIVFIQLPNDKTKDKDSVVYLSLQNERKTQVMDLDENLDIPLRSDFVVKTPEEREDCVHNMNYEDWLKLFYVGYTRAKHALYLFGHKDDKYQKRQLQSLKDNDIDTANLFTPFESDGAIKKDQTVAEENPLLIKPDIITLSHSQLHPLKVQSYSQLLENWSDEKDEEVMHLPLVSQASDKEEILLNRELLPPGAKSGNWLHSFFEADPWRDNDEQKVKSVCQTMHPLEPKLAHELSHVISSLLQVFHQDRPFDALKRSAKEVFTAKAKIEQEFYLSIPAALSIAHPMDQERQLDLEKGWLKGFIDRLVFIDNQYIILDWKSNYLGPAYSDYSRENLHKEMLEADYYLQAHLYALALEQVFASSGRQYHLAGAVYVFARGLHKDHRDAGMISFDINKKWLNAFQEKMRQNGAVYAS